MGDTSRRLIVAAAVIWLLACVCIFIRDAPSPAKEENPNNSPRHILKKLDELQVSLQAAVSEVVAFRSDLDQIGGRLKSANVSVEQIFAHASNRLGQLQVIPVLVFSCNRPTVRDHLDQLIKYRVSEIRHPIFVSQDCGDQNTKWVLESYGDLITLMLHPNLTDIPLEGKAKKFKGYYKIARHYRWALNQIFRVYNHSSVIITEDDLNISPDFFELFEATLPLLQSDPLLWCVSAWNDNGKEQLSLDLPDLLHRTDFFPGLGWMLTRDTWLQLDATWPVAFWDDWLRQPAQRRDRQCIRPEIPRTGMMLAGKKGASSGQYYEKHLKFIRLNENFIRFTALDLTYLRRDVYDLDFNKSVNTAAELALPAVVGGQELPDVPAFRVTYTDKASFKVIAKALGLMDDFKSGVARMAYSGVVSVAAHGRRLFVAPPREWGGYDVSWS